MDILEKIDKLRVMRGWTINKLAYEACINQPTLANLYARNSTPSIATLKSICDAFGMSLAEFFQDDLENKMQLTQQENILLHNYRKLNEIDKNRLVEISNLLSSRINN